MIFCFRQHESTNIVGSSVQRKGEEDCPPETGGRRVKGELGGIISHVFEGKRSAGNVHTVEFLTIMQ